MKTIILALALLVGCAPSTRTTTINTALTMANAANAGFASWDGSHQLEIVNAASSKAEADTALLTYRAKRNDVLLAFVALYQTIATASTVNTSTSLASIVQAATHLQLAIAALESIK